MESQYDNSIYGEAYFVTQDAAVEWALGKIVLGFLD